MPSAAELEPPYLMAMAKMGAAEKDAKAIADLLDKAGSAGVALNGAQTVSENIEAKANYITAAATVKAAAQKATDWAVAAEMGKIKAEEFEDKVRELDDTVTEAGLPSSLPQSLERTARVARAKAAAGWQEDTIREKADAYLKILGHNGYAEAGGSIKKKRTKKRGTKKRGTKKRGTKKRGIRKRGKK